MDTNSLHPVAPATPELSQPEPAAGTRAGGRGVIKSRRKKLSPAESRADRLRLARLTAPLLRDLQPTAAHVAVQLSFADDARLVWATRSFAVYPPARAHFVYACAFGDCNGMHDLDAEVHGLLKAGGSQVAGALCCEGQRSSAVHVDHRCGLQLTYAVSVLYEAPQSRPA
jgi:hypothetical protein